MVGCSGKFIKFYKIPLKIGFFIYLLRHGFLQYISGWIYTKFYTILTYIKTKIFHFWSEKFLQRVRNEMYGLVRHLNTFIGTVDGNKNKIASITYIFPGFVQIQNS